jgi:hypothetical protein
VANKRKRPVRKVPKFKVGQEVITKLDYLESQVRFRIGFIYRGVHDDGSVFFWYTQNKKDAPPFWTEASLRPLTRRERGGK